MNQCRKVTTFSFFPEQSSSFLYQHVFAVYLSPHIRTPAGVAFEKLLAQVSIKYRHKVLTTDLMDYRGVLPKL